MNRKKTALTKFIIYLLLLYPSIAFSQIHLTIDASKKVHKVSPLLWGANIPGWDSVNGKLDKELDDALKSMGFSSLRFPGGFVSDVYHWEYGISTLRGERNKEFTKYPYFKHRRGFLSNELGINEFTLFAEEMKAQPMITVNVGTGTAQEAANWVEYANGDSKSKYGALRLAEGFNEPFGIEHWELGNELYGEWHKLKMSAQTYAEKVEAFSKAMKAKDPSIKIGVIGSLSNQHVEWMYKVIEKSGNYADFIGLHFYYPRKYGKDLPDDQYALAVMSSPSIVDRQLSKIKNLPLIKSRKMDIAITEYNTNYTTPLGRHNTREMRDLKSALSIAGLFQVFIRQDIFMSNVWSAFSPRNDLGLLRYSNGKLRKSPTYYIFSLYANNFGSDVVHTNISGNKEVSLKNIYEKGKVETISLLSVMTTLSQDGETLCLALVNKDLKSDADLSIDLKGFNAEKKGTSWTVTGPDPYATNDGVMEIIKPVEKTFTYDGKVNIPPLSFTLIKLKKKK